MGPSFSTLPGFPEARTAPTPLPIPQPLGNKFGGPRKSTMRSKRKRAHPPQTISNAEDLNGNPSLPLPKNSSAASDVFPKVRVSRIKAQPPRRRLRRDNEKSSEPAVEVPELTTNVTRRDSGGETSPGAGVVPGPPSASDDPEKVSRCNTPNAICYRCLTPMYLDDEDDQMGAPNAIQSGFSASQPAPWMSYSQGDFSAGTQTSLSRVSRQFPQTALGGSETSQFPSLAPSFPWGSSHIEVPAPRNLYVNAGAGMEKPYLLDGNLYTPDALRLMNHSVPLQSTHPALHSNVGQGLRTAPSFGQEISLSAGSGQASGGGLGDGLLDLQGGYLQWGCVGGLPGCSGYNHVSGDC